MFTIFLTPAERPYLFIIFCICIA